jgi:uncharacterized protein
LSRGIFVSGRYGDWMQTYSGRRFWPLDPRPEEIDIVDIAHALSIINRFTGHTRQPYCVAQHSFLAGINVSPQDALWALLHHASEAYISDMSRVIKYMPEMEPYRKAESKIMDCVCDRFGLSRKMPDSVEKIYEILLATEARDLFVALDPEWGSLWVDKTPKLPQTIVPWPADHSERVFLALFRKLYREAS